MVADNVLTCNRFGVGFMGDPANVPEGTPAMGHHLLGGNVYDRNKECDIRVAARHPPIWRLHDGSPGSDTRGLNLPVKTTADDPVRPVDGVLYLNTLDRRLSVYADGAWRILQTTTDRSW